MPTFEPAGTPVAETTNLSPQTFIGGRPVIADDAAEVVSMATYAACCTPVHYCGGFGGGPDFLDDAFSQPSGDKIYFDAALNTWERRYGPNRIKIGVNVYRITLTARCLVAVGEEVEVRLMVDGVQQAILTFDDTDNGDPKTASIDVATLGGAGYYDVQVEIRRTLGGATNQLIMWSLDGESRDPTTLPAPTG
jgi:hypothetical protein